MRNNIIGRGWVFPPRIGPTGGLELTSERNEIEHAIRVILTTAVGERIMRPRFGSRLHDLLFAPNNQQTAALAVLYVEEALNNWEPRITLIEVTAEPDPALPTMLTIHIAYEVKATSDQRSLVYPFYLVPEHSEVFV